MRYEEILYGLRCAACGEEDQLVLDVVRVLVECRCCGARTLAGLLEEDLPGEEFGEEFDTGSGTEMDAERGIV
ncbi:hypothetical protein [Nonomuraea sp. NPDC049028]|uniref:hypothetical protein n=1 Tax=Nonomuraea sp. NPDC049028 TaxID=3364348 RepID=UPI003712AF9E